ncbi:MAG: histidine phosphatase family protein [Coriobacteriaceae bacterium]|nr:histidine phosphatase family protein [Coriobacteriaceae bacterium]
MPTLYLMRHGQTEYNVAGLVQGHCDSPLTEEGVAQARAAGRWFASRGVVPTRLCSSPLGRTRATLEIVRAKLDAAPEALPEIEVVDGLIERSYGSLEGGSREEVPADLWNPGEEVVAYGGEGSRALRERMVRTLTGLMRASGSDSVIAVSHGSATAQFKDAWAEHARCPQDVWIGNCFILVYEFDPATGIFVNTEIADPAEG